MVNPGRFYVADSSIFDFVSYYDNIEKFKTILQNHGCSNFRLARKFGWRNQAHVLMFSTPKGKMFRASDVEREIEKMLDRWPVIIRRKDWR